MKNFKYITLGFFLAASIFSQVETASATKFSASTNSVKAACRRTPGCGWVTNTDGSITGCSPTTCFDCNKKKCHAVRTVGPLETELDVAPSQPQTTHGKSQFTEGGNNLSVAPPTKPKITK